MKKRWEEFESPNRTIAGAGFFYKSQDGFFAKFYFVLLEKKMGQLTLRTELKQP